MSSRYSKNKRVRTAQYEDHSASEDEELQDAPNAPDAPDAPDEQEDARVQQRDTGEPIWAFIPGEGIETGCLMFYVGRLLDKNASFQTGRHWKVSHSMSLRRNG